jgi:hypothetical protein
MIWDSPDSDIADDQLAEALEQLESAVSAALRFAERWDEAYRHHIFETALAVLTGRLAVAQSVGFAVIDHDPHNRGGQVATDGVPIAVETDDPLSKLSRAVSVESDLLRRVIHIDEEGRIEIIGRMEADSTAELQNKYSAVYAYIKEKALGGMHVEIDELRDLCKRHGCYDSSNFTRYFRNDARLRELKGAGGRAKRYVATKQGLDEAAQLIRDMSES